jgi:NAD(P)-dependent dehydrogenase (short-subunit alcohol dehydrogenase family)
VPEVLVYNAALIQSDVLGELTVRQHLDAWAVNVVGAITAIAHLGPAMTEAGEGTILITGGMPQAIPEVTSLSLGKAGVRALTELLARAYEPAGVHVATVTVAGAVAPGTAFDPDDSAEEYWRLHAQPAGSWEREVLYSGRPAPPAARRPSDAYSAGGSPAMTPKVAPCGSATTAKRPTPSRVCGVPNVRPPSSSTRATEASQSSTVK